MQLGAGALNLSRLPGGLVDEAGVAVLAVHDGKVPIVLEHVEPGLGAMHPRQDYTSSP